MKYIVIILFVFSGMIAKAQLPSSTFMSRDFNGNTKADWIILDSPLVNFVGTSTFNARYAGTQFVKIGGGDTAFYFGAGGTLWFRSLLDRDTVSLSNRINLKLNITDTTSKWWGIGKRWVDTVYRVNDSTIGFTINNGAQQTFQILGRSPSGGGGSGTVTSVGLSMPSAFTVTGSPITTSGTLAVSGAGTTAQYIRGNGTLATTDTGMIPNFHLKVRSLFSATSPLTYNSTSGIFAINNANVSGTKGAATFNSVSFSDNGSGLISLNQPVAPGSCINCDITWGSDGRPTSYASGTPPQFVNAPGAGDTLSILDTLKRLNAGFGITHVVTNYNITQKVDTSDIATQFDISGFPSGSGVANQITYWTGTNTIGGDAGMTVNPTTNTIKSDTSNVKKVDISGDSTFSDKIVFYPSKTKPGSSPAMITYGESNNEWDNDSTVNNVLEFKIGPLNGAAGAYGRLAIEKRWRSFPGGPYWIEAHLPEVRLTNGEVYRPGSWTGPEDGGEGVWTHRANLHSYFNWNGQKTFGGFSTGASEMINYHNYSGTGTLEMSVRDSGTAVKLAGFRTVGQIAGGLRNSEREVFGQSITDIYETAPVFRAKKGGQGYSSGWNYVFNILDTNTNHPLIVTKGAGIFDAVYFWIHNDGRTVSGDAGFFFPSYKFQAKPQGANTMAFVAGDYDASNNTIQYLSSFAHGLTSGSGAGAVGMGAGFDFRADNSANTITPIADMGGVWTSVTAGSESGDIRFRTRRTGTLEEVARFKSIGQVQFATYTTSNFVAVDSTNYKPAVFDASGNIYRMGGWPTGSIATTIYTGDGTIAGNRNVNVNNLNLTFSDVNTFRINHDVFAQSKADGTFPYSSVVVAPTQELRTGYTPTVGTFSKGAGITIDTNNNVSLGTGFITSSHPLYTYGSAFAQGFTSARGNFYRVDNYTADQTLTIEQYWINVDASGGNVTITLPAASTAFGSGVGIQYVIRRTDNSGNTLTVQRNGTPGTDTINGATSFTLTTQFEVKEVQAVSTSAYALK